MDFGKPQPTGARDERRWPRDYNTYELKEFLGDFEEQYAETIGRKPELVNYQGVYAVGEMEFMVEMNAARFEDIPYKHMIAIVPGFNRWVRLKSGMRELQDRRDYAKRQEEMATRAL